jgi:flagellar hook-length control protein FliK
MIDAQLGPPPVAASRGGGSAGGESATGTLVETDDGCFVAVLDGHTAPDLSDATGTTQTPPAAGPLTGELPNEAAADADGPPPTTAPADDAALAAALAAAVAAVVQIVPPAAAPTPGLATAIPAAATPAAPGAQVASAAPAIVPAALDAQGRIVPVPPQATPVDAEAPPAGAAPAATQGGPGGGTGAAAAAVTLTLKPAEAASQPALASAAGTASAVDEATAQAPAGAGTPSPAPAPGKPEVANWHSASRPIGHDPATPAARAPEPPPGLALGLPAHAAPGLGAPDGAGRPAGGVTTPHELARELGTRLQMAVREGGRELVVTLRPPELGHLTIRVTMQDGVLQAQILADRPEAARMLQQSLGHLGSTLGDLGYSLENLDVAYGGHDPRDAQASSGDADSPVSGEVLEADGTPVTAPVPSTAVAGSPARLDLLA